MIKLTDIVNKIILAEEMVQSDSWKAIQKTLDTLNKKDIR